MRRFLLIALGMGFLLPTAVRAQGYHLVYREELMEMIISIPIASKESCEREKLRILSNDEGHWARDSNRRIALTNQRYAICINGN